MVFKNFHENSHFQENRVNHVYGEFVKIRKFTLVIISVIFPKNGNLGLKI